MKLTIEIPEVMEKTLQRQLGQDLGQAAKESLAIAWYQTEKLSIGQVAEFLDISVYEAEGLMKRHQIAAPHAITDYEQDRNTLNRVLGS
jgi:predicted HTH domain antitoxin